MKNLVLVLVFGLGVYWFINALGTAIDKEIAFADERFEIHLSETTEEF